MKSKFLIISSILLTIFFLSESVGISAKSKKNQTLLGENKIWRYHSNFNGNMTPYKDIYLNLCLSGKTKIDGKKYYNCYVWQEGKKFSDENVALIAYMREENGKVYVRYIPEAKQNAREKGIDIVPYAPMMASYSHDIEKLSKIDVLIYDNSLKPGDVLYTGADSFNVNGMVEIECFGVKRKVWHLSQGPTLYQSYDYYEGVGDVIGLLPLPGSKPIFYNTESWQLVEVVDKKGKKLFAPAEMITGVENNLLFPPDIYEEPFE